jgi:hypothetical protein
MSCLRISTLTLLILSLIACGGSTSSNNSSSQQIADASIQNVMTTASFSNPFANEIITGNLMVTFSVESSSPIEEITLRFGNNANGYIFCKGEKACQGQTYSDTVSGINPRLYGGIVGEQEISLWITNTSSETNVAQANNVAALTINWQPKNILNVDITRSTDGTSAEINWPFDDTILRYNLYLAAADGVTPNNINVLPEGQAILAVMQGPIEFGNLTPNTEYYVLVTGVDGSGESAFSSEQVITTTGMYTDLPTAINDSYDAVENTTLNILPNQGLLLNDSDPQQLDIVVETAVLDPPSSGQVTLQANGAFQYIPNASFVGTDRFTYQISNLNADTAEAEASINVASLQNVISGNSITINSQLTYSGLGEEAPAGSDIGTGRYRLGECVQHIDTICSVIGDYTVAGLQGSYAFTMSYGGTGVSPVLAHSVAPNSNTLEFTAVGDAIFELSLFPDDGGKRVGMFPDNPFNQSLNFGASIQNNAICQGLPPGVPCTIGETGLNNGVELTASLNVLSFTIPALSLGTGANVLPLAVDDTYTTNTNTPLTITQPGILLNDQDEDVGAIGDQLTIYNQFDPAIGALVGMGYDEYRQLSYVYVEQDSGIAIFDRSGAAQRVLDVPGEAADDYDITIAPQSFELNNVFVPQGSLLIFNGEIDTTDIYVLDPVTGVLLTQLVTTFGNSHVVGGTYNVKTNSVFLLQDRDASVNANTIAEINPQTGDILRTFPLSSTNQTFSVRFGDIVADPITGNLYVISSIESTIAEYKPTGEFVRGINLPLGVTEVSGIALAQNGKSLWLSSNTGQVFELKFNNGGNLPRFAAEIKKSPNNGSLVLNPDGSFVYTPNNSFSGQDSFTYLAHDQNGGVSSAQVVITVN